MIPQTDLVLGRLSYLSPMGGRYKGHLTITDTELLFESDFDRTFEVLNKTALRMNGGKKCLSLCKEDISSIEIKKSFFSNKIVLSLNGKTHVFFKRTLSENQIYNALKT
jgi:hypothetical protein